MILAKWLQYNKHLKHLRGSEYFSYSLYIFIYFLWEIIIKQCWKGSVAQHYLLMYYSKFEHLWFTAILQSTSSVNSCQDKLWIEQNWLCFKNVGGLEGFRGRYCNKNITRRLRAPGKHVQLSLPAWSRPSLCRGCHNNSGLTPSYSDTSQTAISRSVLRIQI